MPKSERIGIAVAMVTVLVIGGLIALGYILRYNKPDAKIVDAACDKVSGQMTFLVNTEGQNRLVIVPVAVLRTEPTNQSYDFIRIKRG